MRTSDKFVEELYSALLKRPPSEVELQKFRSAGDDAKAIEVVISEILRSWEFKHRQGVYTVYPPGHWYSPVVDPKSVENYVEWSKHQDISGVSLSADTMQQFYERNLGNLRSASFAVEQAQGKRFYSGSGFFPHGDALILRSVLAEYRPRRVIEIGSGFSTAAMLDSADEFSLETSWTCIEPYPDRLKSLLRPDDYSRVTIVESDLQRVSLDMFDSLEAGDVLFIDSTHVMKTGSDVHFEIFHIFPRLASGVLVHIHDIQYPFEYPTSWILDQNRSWNEIYAIRAFLMYNSKFSVLVWNDYFRRVRPEWFSTHLPELLPENPGGSIWLTAGSG
jgi:predicted O-methyltransferase YrrM